MDLQDDLDDETLNQLVKLSEAAENSLIPTQCSASTLKKEPGPEHLSVLSKYFGHKNFRSLQWEVISAIIEDQRDVCAVMCTGYGKSLCFQFPSAFTGGVALVISPLIALMEDQVLSLEVANIPACLLGTAQKNTSQVINDILNNKYNLVYLTPEFCTGELGNDLLKRMNNQLKVTVIAIDEAHCISQWGHDFRHQYRNLNCLRSVLPEVPIIAVTATATRKVRDDIIESLKLRNPLLLCSGFNRPNLYFEVHEKRDVFADLTKVMVYKDSLWKFSGPTIVYCITRSKTEEISDLLRRKGINSRPYHAGLSLKVRTETHQQFVRDQIDVVVATIAFGMGIDKPDIANVVHYGASKSIENYYQEVGRAGRDGNPARCVAFFSSQDFIILKNIDEKCGSQNRGRKENNLRLMEEYLITRQCRRRFILNYFDDSWTNPDKPQSNCCDNCTKRRYDHRTDYEIYKGVDEEGKYDFTNDAKILLSLISSISGLGITGYYSILRGSASVKCNSHKNHPSYGAGRDKKREWWTAVVKILTNEDYLQEVRQKGSCFSYSTYCLTNKGKTLLNQINNKETKFLRAPPATILKLLQLKPQKESGWVNVRPQINKPSTSKSVEPANRLDTGDKMKIYRQLCNKRGELASKFDCMPYMVASNAVLMSIAAAKPKTLEEMRALNHLDGFTDAKLVKFGEYFLKIVRDSNSDVDDGKSFRKKQSIQDILDRHPLPVSGTGNFSAGVTCSLHQSGHSAEEIAIKRNLVLGTVKSHLIEGMKAGFPIKLADMGVTKEFRELIIKAFRKHYPSNNEFVGIRTAVIKEECPPEVTFDHIKTVLSYLQIRYHLEKLNIPYEEFEDFMFDEIKCIIAATSNSNDEHCSSTMMVDKENLDITPDIEEEMAEPPSKKEKTDDDSDFYRLLDSPSRTFTPTEELEEVPKKIEVVGNGNYVAEPVEKAPKSVPKARNKVLPPWLVIKKIN